MSTNRKKFSRNCSSKRVDFSENNLYFLYMLGCTGCYSSGLQWMFRKIILLGWQNVCGGSEASLKIAFLMCNGNSYGIGSKKWWNDDKKVRNASKASHRISLQHYHYSPNAFLPSRMIYTQEKWKWDFCAIFVDSAIHIFFASDMASSGEEKLN